MIRLTILVIALALAVTFTQAKPLHRSPSSNDLTGYIKYLLQIIGVENEYTRFLAYLKIFPPNHHTELRKLYDELFSFDAYVLDMSRLYEKHFSLEEIVQLIDFYSSPLGKKMLAFNIDLNRQMEDLMLTKITDYVFTAAEHHIYIPLPELH